MYDSWSSFSTEPVGLGPETFDQIYGRFDQLQQDSEAGYNVSGMFNATRTTSWDAAN